MTKNISFSNILALWYLKNKRNLPWRKTKDPYFIWLSEIILQQTKVSQGASYYLKFSQKFKNISSLAQANEEQILKLWQGLGYYSRARNLHFTAKHIINNLNGVFPDNYNELIKLKGIGDYTASAISSICFNKPHATVDGNVYRVLSRYFGIITPINSSKGIKEFKNLAQLLIDSKNPGTHNQALMEFGALVCKPKNPECENCPLNDSCFALQKQKVNSLPIKINKVIKRDRYFNYLIINNKNKYTLLEQRIGNDIWKNLFEFPLFESNQEVGIKEIMQSEKFLENIKSEKHHLTKFNQQPIVHKLTHQNLYATFWLIDIDESIKNVVLWESINNFAIPTLIQNFVDKYRMNK